MKFILYLLFISLFFCDWLAFKLHLVPRQLTWLPEICSMVILLYELLTWAFKKQFNVSFKYLFLISFFVISIICGFLLNKVRIGVMFSGIRIYLRYLPLFLLPYFYNFKEKEILKLLKFLMILLLFQCPVVLYQRFVKFSTSISGDPMGGTLGAHTSGVLSVVLICSISFLTAFYLKNMINKKKYLICVFLLILPTTLNETKITFFLLPLSFILPIFFLKNSKNYLKTIFIVGLSGIGLILLKTVYDIFAKKRWGYGFLTFLTMPGRFERYIDRRLNPLLTTIKMAFNDIIFFFFGYGAGNASHRFSPLFTGDYASKLDKLGMIRLGFISGLWEIGIIGMSIIFIWIFMIFQDARRLVKFSEDPLFSALGLGMTIVTVIYCISFAYFNTLDVAILSSLFWFFAGLVTNRYYKLNKEKYKRI